jgi:arylsulfatase A-like enzyme
MIRRALFLSLLASLACTAPVERPRALNVLLVTFDTLRDDHCSVSGYERATTPTLEALARDGTRLSLAYAPTATTGPSHASLFTSRYPITHGVVKNGMTLGPELQTLAETLREAGYRTAAVVSSFALDGKFGYDQGFESYDDDFDAAHATITRSEFAGQPAEGAFDQRANETTRKALAELARLAGEDAPFFLFVHYFDPHFPYDPPGEWAARFASLPVAADETRAAIDRYDGEIAFADDELGKLLRGLDDRQLGPDTLVVMTADHGEGLMQHGHLTHGVNIYEEAVRVPLLFRLPGRVVAGRVLSDPIEMLDVAPTILALAGVTATAEPHGRSLAEILAGGEPPGDERPVFLHRRHYEPVVIDGVQVAGEKFGIRLGSWKYIEGPEESTRELYDLEEDPGELRSVHETSRTIADDLASRLAGLRLTYARDAASAPKLSEEDRERLRALGYVD